MTTTLLILFVLAADGRPEPTLIDPTGDDRPAATRDEILVDWMSQDYMRVDLPEQLDRARRQWSAKHLSDPEARGEDPVLAPLPCFTGDSNVVEHRMVRRALDELPEADDLRQQLAELVRAGVPGRDRRWKQLYTEACSRRRDARLAEVRHRWSQFVFTRHRHIPNSWKYTEALSDAPTPRHRYFRPNASLDVFSWNGLEGRITPLLEDPQGMIRNPDVSYDGRHVLFAWKKSDQRDDFHLYEMDLETRSIRQLTFGLGFADYEGIYLPDGNICFNSTRCCQTVDCNWVVVSNFYLMDGAGRYLRRIGFDQVHCIFPTVTDDGRVLYTRWEYNDRAQMYPQPLFQMNPDGTQQQAVYGGNSWFPTNIIHARKIPGSTKILTVVTGHHRPAHGKLAILDPARGRDEGQGVQLIAPRRKTQYVQVDKYALQGNQYQYPYPLDERQFLVSMARPTSDGSLGRFDLYWMDVDGRRELLVTGDSAGNDGVGCKQIIPLAPRPQPHVRSSTVDYRRSTGTVYVQDIYQGLGLPGIERGAIKGLRVVALEYRAAAIGRLHQEGRGGKSEMTTPIAVGNGSWDVKVVLGTATVHPDGSALFEVPARLPVYFQALDQRGHVVQTMRSWTTLMPGETQACVGCHDHKNVAPPPAAGSITAALKAGVQPLEPFYGPPRPFAFAREIQPILDNKCVTCHDGGTGKQHAFSLSGEEIEVAETKRAFSRAYLALTHTKIDCGDWNHPLVNWIDCMSEPTELPPYYRGSATSGLLPLLDKGHYGVRLTRQERDKIACWIDLLVPYCGDYVESNRWSDEERAFYARYLEKRRRMEAREADNLRAWIAAGQDEQRRAAVFDQQAAAP